MRVPYFDFHAAPMFLKQEWKSVICNEIDEGVFINGQVVSVFEDEWASALNVLGSVGTSNGLDGLEVALLSLGVGPGDYVAVPAHTFIATWSAVENVGAIPVGVDTDPHGLMDVSSLTALKTDVAAVIPVHMHGAMVDMKALMEWSKPRGIKVIEDASQAHLAETDGVFAGTWGDLGVFSLYPSKNLGALGDAGIIVSNNQELLEKSRRLVNYGSDIANKYRHVSKGFNRRLDSIQAAVLRVNLGYLNSWNMRRIEIGNRYISGIQNPKVTILQDESLHSVRHHFPVLFDERKEAILKLGGYEIGTEIHYPYLASQENSEVYGRAVAQFPVAKNISEKTLSIPISPWHTDDQIDYVIEKINTL